MDVPDGLLVTAISAETGPHPEAPQLDGPVSAARDQVELVLRKRYTCYLLLVTGEDMTQRELSACRNVTFGLFLLLLLLVLLVALFRLCGDIEGGSGIAVGCHLPVLYGAISNHRIGLAASDDAALVMQEEDVSLQFLVTAEVREFFDADQVARICVELLEFVLGVVLRQVMLAFLLGHLVVGVVFWVKHLHAVKCQSLSENLLFGSCLWLHAFRLDPLDGLRQLPWKYLELKDSEKVADESFAILGGFRSILRLCKEGLVEEIEPLIVGKVLLEVCAVGEELALDGSGGTPDKGDQLVELTL